MDIVSFLKTNYANQDVHVLDLTDGYRKHIGYYFWDGVNQTHKLQLIRDMRLKDNWEVSDIREMCGLCQPAYVSIVDGEYKTTTLEMV